MGDADPRIEAFFDKASDWKPELEALRLILLDCPVEEVFKWRSPCYVAAGGNISTVWGLKAGPVLSFFKGVLLSDPEGILVAPGRNSRSVRMMRFADLAEIRKRRAVIRAYVGEAVALQEAGRTVEFPKNDIVLPDELVERLKRDKALKAAFEALTPGRQRGYALHFAQPKQSKTRAARIDRCADRILAGKGMHDR